MILIVDDKQENIFALKKLLETNKFDVDTALSGEEALKKVLKSNYALIILDVQMPGMDGFEVAESISGISKAKDIPIIFLSAVSTDKKFITKGYNSGGIDYVAKPIDADILMLKVKTFHRLYEQTRELNEIHLALREEIEVRKNTLYEQYRKTQELKSILESIPQIAFTANARGEIEFVNEQWYIYSDYKHKFPEVYDHDVLVPGFWKEAFATPQQLPVEVCIRKTFNNEYRYHLLSLIPVKEGQDIVKWVGSLTDIHAQKRATDALEKQVEKRTGQLIIANEILVYQNEEKEKRAAELSHSEFRLKQAQAIAHIGSWEEDIGTGVKTWSEEVCRIYGIPIEENKQSYESWVSFIVPEDQTYVIGIVDKSQAEFSDCAFHYRIQRKDGSLRYIYCQIHFALSGVGTVTGKYGVVHDVTETRLAQEALALSEANLRMIMDSIPQLISTRNIDGKYLFVNKSFADLMGMDKNEMLKTTLYETTPVKSEVDYYAKQDEEVIVSGETKTDPDDFFTDSNGNSRVFHTVKIPFTVAGTNEKAVLAITSEITEQKKAEAERTKMMAHIVQRNKDLEQFSYIISHNLRSPVANIIGLANLVKENVIEISDGKELMGHLGDAVNKLDEVIKDLNYILQLKDNESRKKENIRFSGILKDIKSSISNLIENDNAEIISDFSAVDEMLTLKSYIHSIFLNLITNSIKYKQAEIEPVLKIFTVRDQNTIQIVFQDNGMGIDLKKRGDQVFGLYKRFHTHVDGKGMGLYMVKTHVESLGGKINITSEVNKGTEFRIEFSC